MNPEPVPAETPEPAGTPAPTARSRRAARRHWIFGTVLALGFHFALLGLTRVGVDPRSRRDSVNPRVTWVGDAAVLEEHTLQGQQLRIFDDAPLFLPTSLNYAGSRPAGGGSRRPGELFASKEPVLIMPVNRSPPGLVVAPTDRSGAVTALQGFRWPYLSSYGRNDPVARPFEVRRARIEVRSIATGALVLQESIPAEMGLESETAWPDWRPFGLYVTLSESGRLSEPVMLGGGSGSDIVDRFMREHVRRGMRLDLRAEPGSYRVAIGP